MTEGTLVLEVGGRYRDEDGYDWVIAGKIKDNEPVFIGYLPIFGGIRDADCFFANGVSVTGRTKNLAEPLVLEVGECYEDDRGEFWTVRSGINGSFRLEDNFGHERYHLKDGTFGNYSGMSGEKSYSIRANLIRKVEPKRVEAGVGVGTKNVAEELYEMAKKHQTTEAVAQRLIERATEAAKNGETKIEIETYVFYDQRLQAELYKHGFTVVGLYIQSRFSLSSSHLDKVYLSWGETGSKAGAK